ncbi:MAG: T9SS-dependent M36 family metallopeptidase [Saprospiraceae bacterium]
MKLFTRVLPLVALFIFVGSQAFGQKGSKQKVAEQYIQSNLDKWGLSQDDVQDLIVQDEYTSKSSGVTHVILLQRYKGVEIYNAICNVAVTKEGKAFSVGNRFVSNLSEKVNGLEPQLNALDAVISAARQLGISDASGKGPVLKQKLNSKEYVFEGNSFSHKEIPVKLCLQQLSGELRLSWNLSIDMLDNSDYWSVRVDAVSGNIIDRNNYTNYCKFDKGHVQNMEAPCAEHHSHDVSTKSSAMMAPMASYRVFAIPAESPNHGPQVLLVNPEDTVASPFGWHDTDGVDGAEYTITRGNNVHAYLDVDDNNFSSGDEPDGGADLLFDFPYDFNKEPGEMQDAAVTNLFYMNNYIHDFTFRYGFDEEAGNFQSTNYTGIGRGGDYVEAQAQDGGGTNNANFSTPPDGSNGRMQMYLWERSSGALRIDAPAEIAGWYDTGTADFGPDITVNTNITGQIVEVDDEKYNPYNTDGCEEIKNVADITGNIALIDRGGCFFEQKTVNAEAAGAIAVIICNFDEDAMGMAGAPEIPNPGIPTISLGKSDCDAIRLYLSQGVQAFIGIEAGSTGPENVDGDFDNGIIAHEFGHGVSNRLTGGPSTGGCLGNEEQMGEGWSDFFSLVTTTSAGDNGERPRGIGTFAIFQNTTGRGIRPYPYSTDMTTNPLTYNDISQLSIPHGLGSVWCTMLWDMYWAFVDVYGFDPDIVTGTGGNNMAVQLVMDGMKLQACNPGFVDGRDAILLADELLYNGENQCLIWEVFARRGLGYFADQGSSNNAADGTESYEALPTCIKELKITKTVTPLIQAGDDVMVTLKVTNHKEEDVSNLVISDELPAGMTFLELESTTGVNKGDVTVDNSNAGMVSFTWNTGNGGLATLDEATFTYRLSTDPSKFSKQIYLDDIPDNSFATEDRWLIGIESDQNTSSNIWLLSNEEAHSGEWAWNVDDHPLDTRQVLELVDNLSLTGENPTIRFFHKYDCFPGRHGGVFEISTDGGVSYENTEDRFIRNGYTGQIIYQAFTIPDFYAFFGKSGEFVDSYVDVSDLKDTDIRIRYRFGTQDTTEFSTSGNPAYRNYFGSNQGGRGWTVDDFELMDLFSYNGEVCITSDEGDMVCTSAPNKGTIVDTKIATDVKDLGDSGAEIAIFPNPASQILTFAINSKDDREIDIQMLSVDGRLIHSERRRVYNGEQVFSINVNSIPEGFYFVKVKSGDDFVTEKVMIQR